MRCAGSVLAALCQKIMRPDEADSPYQGEMSRRDKRGRDHRALHDTLNEHFAFVGADIIRPQRSDF